MSALNVLLAIIVISVVIIFHEFGHFLLAKVNGVEVVEFSLGMGPRLLSKKWGKTRYSLKLLPLGGSCQMLGEDEGSDAPGTFNSKNVWQRISIVFAGPFFNFILAFVLAVIIIGVIGIDKPFVMSVDEKIAAETGLQEGDIIKEYNGKSIGVGRELSLYETLDGIDKDDITIVFERDGKEYEATYSPVKTEKYYLGVRYTATEEDTEPAVLSEVIKDSAADKAGLKAGDIITSLDGNEIKNGQAFSDYLTEHPLNGEKVKVVYTRDGKSHETKLTPKYDTMYDLGFGYNVYYREKQSPLSVAKYGVLELKYWVKATVKSLVYMVEGKASTEDIGGPVRVVSEMSNVVEESYETDGTLYAFLNLINWAILLSANLGVMNLLPIPALDGGRLLFMIVEVVRGKKLNAETEGKIHLIGFVLLMVLMVFIFFNDIKNLIQM